MRLAIALLLCCCLHGVAWADPVHVSAEGTGSTREMAITKALTSAIEQATGVTIDEALLSTMMAETASADASHETMVNASQGEAISRKAGGTIRSYRITSVMQAAEGGLVAAIEADIEVFTPKGLGNESRRRIAVTVFDDGSTHGLGLQLRDRLLAYLTQTRRFAVVDRAHDQAYEQEMAIATSQDAAPSERAPHALVVNEGGDQSGSAPARDAAGRGACRPLHARAARAGRTGDRNDRDQ